MESAELNARVLVLGSGAHQVVEMLAKIGFWSPLGIEGDSGEDPVIDDSEVWEKLEEDLRGGSFWGVLVFFPLGTFGKAYRPAGRNRSRPWGESRSKEAHPEMWERVELENRIVLRFLSLLKISREV